MMGTRVSFLCKTQERNQQGDVPSPWIAFPGQDFLFWILEAER
jgi:hypothetical protein